MTRFLKCATALPLALASCAFSLIGREKRKTLFLLMTDGLRWQEVFHGADAALMNKENGAVSDPDALKRLYWRELARPGAKF